MPPTTPPISSDRRTAPAQRRATVIIAVIIAMVIVAVAVVSTVGNAAAGGAAPLVLGARAEQAAEAAANIAVQEVIRNVDVDGDGTIGSVSNDGNTATDPTIAGTRLWATRTVSGNVTTVTARGSNAGADAAVTVTLTGSGTTTAGNILLVVLNSAAPTSQESARSTLFQSWGYTVTLISETASASAFTSAANAASVVYISETVNSGNVGTKLTNATCGVITEESSLSDELGFSTSMTTLTTAQINITNGTHYITSTVGTGVRSLFSASQPLRFLSGTLGSFTTLGTQTPGSAPTLAVMERGAALAGGGTAAGRRVYLPWGNSGMDINQLSADGTTILKRSIEWCLQPIAWYKLDDASGTTAVDSIAARNGTLVNGPAWTTGRISGGLRFNGIDSYVTIANATAFQVTQAFSVCGWIRQTAAWPTGSFVCPILRKGDVCPVYWQLCIQDGRVAMVVDDCEDATPFLGNTTLALNTWVHVAGTWDGATVRVYVNGVSDMTPASNAGPIGTDTRAVYLGGRINATDITTGSLDDVRFYDRALTAAEVAAIAAGGTPVITNWQSVQP